MPSAYQSLVAKHRELALISSTSSVLDWDQETFLPPHGIDFRSEQLAFLAGWVHSESTSETYARLLDQAENDASTHPAELANIREWRHHFDLSNKLPKALVERCSKTSSLAKAAWAEARSTSSFTHFAPHLEKLLEIAKEKADRWGYEDEPYDALLSHYERGANTRDILNIFEPFEPAITDLAKQAVDLTKASPCREWSGEFPIASQQILNREIAEAIGFQFASGRIDTTTHPFLLHPRTARHPPHHTLLQPRFHCFTLRRAP